MDESGWGIALGAGRRLVLAGAGRAPLWLGLGLVALVLLVVLYRAERRLVSRRTGLALLGLRLAAALALVVALFEPVAERSWREAVRGRVVLGVDLSESMATADPGRPAADREALREALGLSAGEDPGALPRREVARRLLGAAWLRRLGGDHEVEALGFARDAAPASPAALAERLKAPPEAGLATDTTDWEPVLARALAGAADGAPTLGVVLLTDGRRNAPAPASPAIDRLRERGIPVFPVLVGSTVPPRDAAIAAVVAPETAEKGQAARVDVTVKLDGVPAGREVPVTLERPGGPPLRETVRAQADGGRPVVRFRVPFESAGEPELTVTVGPIDGDARPDNDRRARKVTVADDRARVLLVDSEPRWEFQYLRNALVRDPRVTLETVVLRQPPAPDAGAPFYPSALPPAPAPTPATAPGAKAEPDPLNGFDLIVLGDLAPDDLPPEGWARVDRYVAERGGTLVLTAGVRGAAALAAMAPIRDILPLSGLRPVAIDPAAVDPARPALPAGAAVIPTLSAASGPWPMLQFADDPGPSRAAWANLPRLPHVLAGTPKPAATVLAVATLAPAAAALESADPDGAAIAAMPYGLGKSLWVGTDSTWRWRFRVGDAYHHRFWARVVQWATRGSLTAGNRLVQFGPTPPRVAEDTPATIRARFADGVPGVDAALLVAARIYRKPEAAPGGGPAPAGPGAPVAVVPLRPRSDAPRQFEAAAPALPPGAYVVRLEAPQLVAALEAEGPPPEAALEVRPRETPERVELAAAREPLEALAAATGGRVLAEAEVAALPGLLAARRVTRLRVEPTALWDRPESLVLLFGLLTAEWLLRKRAGLP
jgi:hypothetical protein